MMDEEGGRGGRLGGAFGGLGGLGAPSMGGIGGAGAMGQLSPYLNIDPAYLSTETPQFIHNEEQKRGTVEKSFTAIGSSVLIGGAIGGTFGAFEGVRQTMNLTGKTRRTQILNYISKSGGTVSNALGSLAVIYSLSYTLAGQVHESDDDGVKSCFAGTFTGALYKSGAGLRKCGMAGAFGLGAAALWSFVLKRDRRISDYI